MDGTTHILIVEDNLADQVLFEECAGTGHVPVTLHFVFDGVEAMAFLTAQDKRAFPRPHSILLDLNLPRMDGRELLERIKSEASLEGIPVVVMSTSSSGEDIAKAKALGAVRYVVKPSDLDAYTGLIDLLVECGVSPAR